MVPGSDHQPGLYQWGKEGVGDAVRSALNGKGWRRDVLSEKEELPLTAVESGNVCSRLRIIHQPGKITDKAFQQRMNLPEHEGMSWEKGAALRGE